jgi:hypothetical protein
MVRFVTSAAAHNVAGGETMRLVYHRANFKSKYPCKCLFCNAILHNEKGRPMGAALDCRAKLGEKAL